VGDSAHFSGNRQKPDENSNEKCEKWMADSTDWTPPPHGLANAKYSAVHRFGGQFTLNEVGNGAGKEIGWEKQAEVERRASQAVFFAASIG